MLFFDQSSMFWSLDGMLISQLHNGVSAIDTALYQVNVKPMHMYRLQLEDRIQHSTANSLLTASACMEVFDDSLNAITSSCTANTYQNPIYFKSKSGTFYVRVAAATTDGQGSFLIQGAASATPFLDPSTLPTPIPLALNGGYVTGTISALAPKVLYSAAITANTVNGFYWEDYENSGNSGDVQISVLDSNYFLIHGPDNLNGLNGYCTNFTKQRAFLLVEPGPLHVYGNFMVRVTNQNLCSTIQ